MAITTPQEGQLTKKIEKKTAKIQSVVFLAAGLTSLGLSIAFKCMGRKSSALFVGQFASPFLIMGLYDKIVKTEGHD